MASVPRCDNRSIVKQLLAATVMMDGLLEALLVARINKLSDQSQVFKAKSAPKEKKQREIEA